MALTILCSPLPRKILIAGVCALSCGWLQAPVALAQHALAAAATPVWAGTLEEGTSSRLT